MTTQELLTQYRVDKKALLARDQLIGRLKQEDPERNAGMISMLLTGRKAVRAETRVARDDYDRAVRTPWSR